MTTTQSNAKHLTSNGRRRNVKAGTVAQIWLDDCQGVTTGATVETDLCWGNLVVRFDGRTAVVAWNADFNAYRVSRYI
jgi:hypothetical protein